MPLKWILDDIVFHTYSQSYHSDRPKGGLLFSKDNWTQVVRDLPFNKCSHIVTYLKSYYQLKGVVI